jgi:hypothetical protein
VDMLADLDALDFRWRTFLGLEGLRSRLCELVVESSGEHEVDEADMGGKTFEWVISEVALLANPFARFESSRGFLDDDEVEEEGCLRDSGPGSEGMEMVSEPE